LSTLPFFTFTLTGITMNPFTNKSAVFGIALISLAGCSSSQTAVKADPAPAITAKSSNNITVQLKSVKPLNSIAAIVNEDIITTFDVKREAEAIITEKQRTSPVDDASKEKIRNSTLDMLIEKALIKQKVKELNIKISDDEVKQSIDDVKKQNNMTQDALVSALASQGVSFEQYRSQLVEQLERLRLVSMEVRSNILVTESEILAHYEANPAKFSEEEEFRARHIFFKVKESSPADELKSNISKALMVLAEARGGSDFIELAKKHSQDPAAAKDGGDMGTFKKGDMQSELENAILGLKAGEISELVYTPLGLHIIKLEERRKGKLKPLDSVKNDIQEQLYKKKSEERFARWLKELRSKASIEIKSAKSSI
jgi:peptidyl-prolyl cis-trans isomerase SurA